MKKSVKFLSMFLAAVMTASSFIACSETTSGETEAAAAETSPEPSATEPVETPVDDGYINDDLPEVKYDGYNFNILSCYFYNRDSANLMMFDEMTGDPVNDVLFEAKCNVEDRFDVSVTWTNGGGTTDCSAAFRNSVNAQDKSFDLSIGNDTETAKLTTEGLALNLFEVDAFNIEKPWWPENTVSGLSIGDKLYCASTYLTYLGLHWTRILTVNKDAMADLNMEIPYDMVREGTWTLDQLYTLTEGTSQDVNGNGKIDENDKVAFTSGTQTWYCMQIGAGIPIYDKDENNIPYLNIDLEKIEAYVNIMDKLINNDDYLASGQFGIDAFQSGKAMIAYTQVGDAYDYYRLSDVTYGFLPTPKLNEQQENYINCCTDMPWAMPKTLVGEEAERAGTIIEAFQCYNYNHMLPVYFEGALKARISDSPDDAEMMQIISDTRAISFAFTYNLNFRNLVADCVLGKYQVASYFKRGEKVAKNALDVLVKKYTEME